MNAASAEPAVHIRTAELEDVSDVVRILSDGAKRMRSLGESTPWPDPFPRDRIEPYLAAKCVFLATLEDLGPIGTFMVTWDDDPYWELPLEAAGYLHRMVVLRRHSGQRISAQIFRWVFGHVRARGRHYVRLDCLEDAEPLRRYYESFGFRYVRSVVVRGFSLALYECHLSD